MKTAFFVIGLALFIVLMVGIIQNELNDPVRNCQFTRSFVSAADGKTVYNEYQCPSGQKYVLN